MLLTPLLKTVALAVVLAGLAALAPASNGPALDFTYQGFLKDGASAANGVFDFECSLWDNNTTTVGQLGTTIIFDDVTVTDGVFALELNFGPGIITGEGRWLEIGVRPGGDAGDFAKLAPRQPLNSAPQALALPGLYTDYSKPVINVIAGGPKNIVAEEAYGVVIGGGGPENPDAPVGNAVFDDFGVVAGGADNVAGLDDNFANNQPYATVGGGFENHAQYWAATVAGGENGIAGNAYATVGGGVTNHATGFAATIPGGQDNVAEGDYSFAAGLRAIANHNGAFVWADSIDADFASTDDDQFLLRAGGGVGINENAPQATLHIKNHELVIPDTALENDDVIVEAQDAALGLYSDNQGSAGSAIAMKEMQGGALNDTWGIVRESTAGGGKLLVTYGTSDNYFSNPARLTVEKDGDVGIGATPSARLHVRRDAGSLNNLLVENQSSSSGHQSGLTLKVQESFGRIHMFGPNNSPSPPHPRMVFSTDPVISYMSFLVGGVEEMRISSAGVTTAAKPRTMALSPAVFSAVSPAAHVSLLPAPNDGGARVKQSGGAGVFTIRASAGAKAGENVQARAMLHLPDGATLASVTGFVTDTAADGDVALSLVRVNLATGEANVIASAATDGTPGDTALTAAVISDAAVSDNAQFGYHVEYSWSAPADAGALTARGVRVDYSTGGL